MPKIISIPQVSSWRAPLGDSQIVSAHSSLCLVELTAAKFAAQAGPCDVGHARAGKFKLE